MHGVRNVEEYQSSKNRFALFQLLIDGLLMIAVQWKAKIIVVIASLIAFKKYKVNAREL